MSEFVRLLARSDVERTLPMRACIAAVENAFRLKGLGRMSPGATLGVHVGNGGFHAKAAFLELARAYFVVKVNANFPGNPARLGLPTIQGVLVLFDATNGIPLAVMDSMFITQFRTAAASAVAASYLARTDAHSMTVVGCGAQGRAHVASIACVRKLRRVYAFDSDLKTAERFVSDMQLMYPFEMIVATELGEATRVSEIVVTATSSRNAFLGVDHISPGTFVAAVGADSEHKQELHAELLGASTIVVDDLEQCSAIGDLHHALEAGIVVRSDVHAELHNIVAGVKPGRVRDDEIVIFDSTGIAIEDVAAAALVYECVEREGTGSVFSFGS